VLGHLAHIAIQVDVVHRSTEVIGQFEF
jgi:hypothetical protein